jgi:hypothetical protein
MERVKVYLGSIQVPSYADLKSGEYFRKFLQPPEVQNSSYIQDFESSLVYLQEVVLWTDKTRSLCWLAASQLLLYQFIGASTPVLSSTAYVCLLSYLYITWTQQVWPAIKLQPEHSQDEEKWTPMSPDTLSAPEMETLMLRGKRRTAEIYHGLWLLRAEYPLRFCITMSVFFSSLALLGARISTPLFMHSLALSLFSLPPLLIHLSRNKRIEPYLILVGEILASLTNIAVYRGKYAPPQESIELKDFLPEQNSETMANLDIHTKPSTDKEPEDCLSMSLGSDLCIPSHEEVDRPSLDLDLDHDLIPAHRIEDDGSGDDEIEGPVGRMRGVEEEDSDDADHIFSLPATTTASLSSQLSSLLPAASILPTMSSILQPDSISQVLGSLLSDTEVRQARQSSEPDLEDFELISEDDLEKESP